MHMHLVRRGPGTRGWIVAYGMPRMERESRGSGTVERQGQNRAVRGPATAIPDDIAVSPTLEVTNRRRQGRLTVLRIQPRDRERAE